MGGTLVGACVVVGVVGETDTVAVTGAETVCVVTVCVVAVADGIVGDATTVVNGADGGVPPTVPDGDCSGLATGVRDDVGETVAPGVAVAAFAVDAGDDDTRRPVALAGGGDCTTGTAVAVAVGAIVGDAAAWLVGVADGVIVGDGWAVPVPAAPTVCDPRVPNPRRLPMIIAMPRRRMCCERCVLHAAVCAALVTRWPNSSPCVPMLASRNPSGVLDVRTSHARTIAKMDPMHKRVKDRLKCGGTSRQRNPSDACRPRDRSGIATGGLHAQYGQRDDARDRRHTESYPCRVRCSHNTWCHRPHPIRAAHRHPGFHPSQHSGRHRAHDSPNTLSSTWTPYDRGDSWTHKGR